MGEISPAVANEINRDFHSSKPNEKWLTDITEFNIGEKKVYLSPIIDCFDGLPVFFAINNHTPLRGEQQATIYYDWRRCEE